ncbi:MAG: CoA transferase, partial [Rhodospirillaceae bacterium]|nr:CoA transferase [Rhodospirillaceae bacterium]
QVVAREMKAEVAHPLAGTMAVVANPLKFSKTKIEYDKAPPTLGQHTDEVLGRILGLSQNEIARLRKSEII